MSSTIDYTSPSTQFFFDLNKNTSFKKDNQNFINELSIDQVNTLNNTALLDIFLSANNLIEPHYHQNAAELVYCISGSATISVLNPFTKQFNHYPITPGQVVNIPQGWWHYDAADVDDTHLLAIFNAPTIDTVLGSDLLALTPANIIAHTYCLDEKQWKKAVGPVRPGTFIGPRRNCEAYSIHHPHPNVQHSQPYNAPIFPSHYESAYPIQPNAHYYRY
ncbi:cupin domain-containing protein [Peribacillus sp. FSL H8-0477]|uniref:cupin domain-containing protein n=1 Tax=Peribacillus sp. FSL H8-0477 TaxID=2921388 RepID=UPI0030F4E2C2